VADAATLVEIWQPPQALQVVADKLLKRCL